MSRVNHILKPGGLSDLDGEFGVTFNDTLFSNKQPCPHCVEVPAPPERQRYRDTKEWTCPRTLTSYSDQDSSTVCLDCVDAQLAALAEKKEGDESVV